jgi:hypothetical protein
MAGKPAERSKMDDSSNFDFPTLALMAATEKHGRDLSRKTFCISTAIPNKRTMERSSSL